MDDFKKANTNEYTSYDLNVNCVCINNKNKRKLKKMCNKKARAKLKNNLIIDYKKG